MMRDGQFTAEAKVFFAQKSKRPCLHLPSQRARPLPHASKSQARAGGAFRLLSSAPVVEYFSPERAILLSQLNAAMPRATVPDDVGHPFAHRPGKHGVEGQWESLFEGVNLVVDPRRFQELPGPPQSPLYTWSPLSCSH